MKIGLDISVLNDKRRTGIGVYSFELVKALVETHPKDSFVLFGIGTLSTADYLKNLEFKDYPNVKMKIYRMPARFFRTAFLSWQKWNWPTIETFTGPVDVFHSFNWFMPPQKSGKKAATVFDLTAVDHPEWHDRKTTWLDKVRLERVAGEADLTVVISESTRRDFLRLNPKGRVEVIYPGVRGIFKGGDVGSQDDRGEKILRKYGLEKRYLLGVGTLEPRKNLEGLIKAYLEADVAPPLVLAGKSGWKNEGLFSLIQKYPGRIKNLGFVPDEDLAVLYRQALVFIYPSFYEGFGLPVLEAMSCGTPVITSRVSSLPEAGGKAVIYVDPENRTQIAGEVRKIVGNRDKREEMREKGFFQAKKFSWKKSAEKLYDLYHQL